MNYRLLTLVLLPLLTRAVELKNPFDINILPYSGYVCAFGDIDGDRYTDILTFVANETSAELIWLNQEQNGQLSNESSQVITLEGNAADWMSNKPICTVGDFDGDSILDLLVSRKTAAGYEIVALYLLHWEVGRRYKYEKLNLCSFGTTKFQEEPNFFDFNGDGLADIIGIDDKQSVYCQLGYERPISNPTACTEDGSKACTHNFIDWKPKTQAEGIPWMFVDLDSDLSAEIIIPVRQAEERLGLEVWRRATKVPGKENSAWVLSPKFIPDIPSDHNYFGAPLIADFDGDSRIEIVVPVCKDERCDKVTALLFSEALCTEASSDCRTSSWESMSIDLFDVKIIRSPESYVLFRVGDFDLDGFPDLVGTFTTGNETMPKILNNEECADCGLNLTRKFSLKKNAPSFILPKEVSLGKSLLSSFFDLKEDGNLDILVEYEFGDQKKFSFIPSKDKGDTTFLKVQTYTNVCGPVPCRPDAKGNEVGSGISWPGACVRFEMTDSWTNGKKEGVSCQLSTSTHRSLGSPYTLFGLGRSPNFVDKIVVGAPRQVGRGQSGTFTQLVPNSRIFVIPPKEPDGTWAHRLFVTPSQLIIQSLIVLASVCLLLLLVAIFLHIRERKEDKVERQAQSHRFHFDAM
ncbi:unnamed protein product, partial [Mesorhabditis spiculigera]